MRLERFRGRDVAEALDRIRTELGEDALVLHTHTRPGAIEVVATTQEEIERFDSSLRAPVALASRGRRSRVIALVGPTGSGKTTTAVKLALSDVGFGGSRVALISLDTYKIGAFDQIQIYSDLTDLPLEVLTEPEEAAGALARLADCDVVIVDTPGRTPSATPGEGDWRRVLAALEPDEVHFVLSAGVRDHVADGLREHYASLGPTHVLLTKLDEVPGEVGVGRLADRMRLPARWITDGQVVPDDVHSAPERLVAAALGRASEPRPVLAGV